MFYIYTKEKIAKVKFTVNLTAEEVKQFMGNNLFLDYPDLIVHLKWNITKTVLKIWKE